jgi:hypothetical protein
MDKQRNAHQNWLFFTSCLALQGFMRVNYDLIIRFYHTWITAYTVPIAAVAIVFAIRFTVKIGDRFTAVLRSWRVPAWLLFAATLVGYFWWANQFI